MKNKKMIFIVICIIVITIIFFKKNIAQTVYETIYTYKYNKIEAIHQDLSYTRENKTIENNKLTESGFNIVLSNFEYETEDGQGTLNFELNFSHNKPLNSVGYILRIYNEDYFLGDRYNGHSSLSAQEQIMYSNIFWKKTFQNIKDPVAENNLLNISQQVRKGEILDDGSLSDKIEMKIPEQFIIEDNLNIILFDLNYQYIGDKTFYRLKEPLTEIKYKISIK